MEDNQGGSQVDEGSSSSSCSGTPGLAYVGEDHDFIPCPRTLKNLKEVKDIPPLRGYEDYESWRNNVFDTLQINGMYQFFAEGATPPSDPSKANRWIQANSWIRQLLLRSISTELIRRLQLSRITNYNEIYERTKKHVLSLGLNCVSAIQYKWDHLKFTNFDHTIARIYELQTHLETLTKRQMTNQELVDKLIRIVPEKLQRSAIDAKFSNSDINFEDLVARLKCHCSIEEQKRIEERVMNKNHPHQSRQQQSQPTKVKGKNFVAAEKENKKKPNDKQSKSKLQCNHCKKYGHTESKCFKKMKCYNCNKIGHISKYCRENKNEKKNEYRREDNEWDSPPVTANLVNLQMSNESSGKDEWLFDPGSSAKIVNSKSWFIDYTPLSTKKQFQVGNGRVSEAYGRGKVKAQIKRDGRWIDSIIHDVYYVPQCPFNLWTPKSLLKEGLCIKENDNGEVKLTNSKGTFLEGRHENGLIWLYIRAHKNFIFAHTPVDTETWHKRLAHTSATKIKLMSRNNAVDGLESIEENEYICDSCLRTRATKPPAPFHGKRERVKAGESFSTDLCGPFPLSIHNNKYFLICKDEATSYREIYFTKSKSAKEVMGKIESYINLIETQVNTKVKRMRSDNGLEFTNTELEEYLQNKGIIHELTQVEGPWQNPAERENRTITEKTRALLSDGALPPLLWDEIANTVVYIHNRVLNRREREVTPYELMFNYKPTVAHLRILGCAAYAKKLRTEKENKISQNAWKGILIGYDENSTKIYRIYIPETNRIIRTSAVKFNENDLPLMRVKNDQEVVNLRDQVLNRFNWESESESESESEDEMLMAISSEKLPSNYKEAIESEEAEQWKKAINDEIKSIQEHNVYTLVDPSPGHLSVISGVPAL